MSARDVLAIAEASLGPALGAAIDGQPAPAQWPQGGSAGPIAAVAPAMAAPGGAIEPLGLFAVTCSGQGTNWRAGSVLAAAAAAMKRAMIVARLSRQVTYERPVGRWTRGG